jgi:hypothetical protein
LIWPSAELPVDGGSQAGRWSHNPERLTRVNQCAGSSIEAFQVDDEGLALGVGFLMKVCGMRAPSPPGAVVDVVGHRQRPAADHRDFPAQLVMPLAIWASSGPMP